MRIIISEQQLSHIINEIAWRSKIDYLIILGEIPITQKITNILYGDIRIDAFHISSIKNIQNMKLMIGTKKVLSAFTTIHPHNINKLNGIQTRGGIIYQINGKLILNANSDVYSKPDVNGLRWIHMNSFFPSEIGREFEQSLYDNIIYDKDTQQKINDKTFITQYIKRIEDFVIKYRNEIINHILNVDSETDWDEKLVTDIQIKDILWSRDFVEEKYMHDITQNYNTPFNGTDDDFIKMDNIVNNIQKTLESISSTGNVYETSKSNITPARFIYDRQGMQEYNRYFENYS